MEEYKKILAEKGLVAIDLRSFPDQNLLDIASLFGRIVPGARGEIIQLLPARDKGYGPIGSFSYTAGYDAFPWHTDTAYWPRPARYLMLTSDKPSPCATLYQDFYIIKAAIPNFDYLMSRAVFMLNVPGQKRYVSPFFLGENGERGYRLDFHIYRPMNEEAHHIMEKINVVLSSHYNRMVWTGANAVIIDNWRYIHAREDVNRDKTRILKRIYINELV